MRQILFYAKHPKQIEANAKVLDTDFSKFAAIGVHSDKTVESIELDVMTKVFSKKGWECYWTCLEWLNLDNGTIQFFEPFKQTTQTIKLNQLSDNFAAIIFRIIASVEGQRDFISKAIDSLQSNFSGLLINHPETMKYGIRKDYILELQENKFPVIPTAYFDKSVSYADLYKEIDSSNEYIIKPVTGELSNSFAKVENADYVKYYYKDNITEVETEKTKNGEQYLRRKEEFIGGWLLQPYYKDILDEGEFQLVFFRETFSHGLKKTYKNQTGFVLPSQKQRETNLYNPTEKEIELALNIKDFFEKKLLKPIYTFRFDYLKLKNGEIKILEFEILNPGFFIGYLKDDEAKFNVAHKFALEINRMLSK